MDVSLLEQIIYGRALPKIYAFETSIIPSYMKIGDTYRHIRLREREWKKKYPNLDIKLEREAFVNADKDVFFRDYSVHKYLLDYGKERLTRENLSLMGKVVHYSNEFFKDTSVSDIEKAIEDIKLNYSNGSIYDYYSIYSPRIPQGKEYLRVDKYPPRPNQEKTINKFIEAVTKNGRKNLLMYAVMRFGKSVTSLWCAKKLDAKIVVVISGKADVREEWKKTLESHVDFDNPEYVFITASKLAQDENLIKKTLETGRRVVLFFTLQDFLRRKKIDSNLIKEKHKEFFQISNEGAIDLLIIDETHYGARAPEYSKVLIDDSQDIELLYQVPKTIKSKVTMHLSGTPYKILMNSEFDKEDIVAFYQFTDLVEDQKAWDLAPENEEKEEWENPYYGFPQMVRFAFNLNERALLKIDKLRENRKSTSLFDIFEPESIKKDAINMNHEKFKHEEEVLDFLYAIDHKNDGNLLSFLNNASIQKGKLCQHMVFVLPYRASCDAMEKIITKKEKTFKNLQNYKILNISGYNQPKKFQNEKGVKTIKKTISDFANKKEKTITLTVNRCLTGTTVKEWDTMLYLKGGYSPQEYDQAIYRLQNPWIQEYSSLTGKVMKINMKPQTLVVDFDLTRMFLMAEEKAKIYNINIDENGNDKLKERLKKELEISPLIWVQADKLQKVSPENITDIIRKYSCEKSVVDEAKQIPVDFSLLDISIIRKEIEAQSKISSKNKLEIRPAKETGQDLDIQEVEETEVLTTQSINTNDEKAERDLKEKIATYYARILFFSFLTNSIVKSLKGIIDAITLNNDDKRIAENLNLKVDVLQQICHKINPHILSQLDYKIENINELPRDARISVLDRVKNAIKKFTILSESEVITPYAEADKLLDLIGIDNITKLISSGSYVLDIASKSGEFASVLYEKLIKYGYEVSKVANKIVSLPTSSFAYEFTRKTYQMLGMDISNIIDKSTTYDLLKEIQKDNASKKKKKGEAINNAKEIVYKNGGKKMKFDLIIGNPPYQDKGGSGGNNDAAIYQHFVEFAISLNPKYSAMIIPARWFAAGRENLLGSFRSRFLNSSKISDLVVYSNASDIFKDVQIEGGVCYYKYEREGCFKDTNYKYFDDKGEPTTIRRKLNTFDVLIADPFLESVVKKIDTQRKTAGVETVDTIISNDTPFGIASNPKTSKKTRTTVYEKPEPSHNTMLFHIEKGQRKKEYVAKEAITKNKHDIDKYKVFITGAYGGREKVLSVPIYAPRNSVCSQSYLYAAFDSAAEAKNFLKYVKTKFFRVLVSAMKITQSAPKRVYRFVPMQDFSNANKDIDWSKPINEIDKVLYNFYGLTSEEIAYIDNKVKGI